MNSPEGQLSKVMVAEQEISDKPKRLMSIKTAGKSGTMFPKKH